MKYHETILKVTEGVCGEVSASIYTMFITPSWLLEAWGISEEDSNRNYVILMVGINSDNDDDFGGAMFYCVPKEHKKTIIQSLIDWLEIRAETPIEPHEFYENFYPHFENVLDYWNW